jgi:A118 family predicted phage portal protein
MALPTFDQVWPPLDTQVIYEKMAEWAAWYSGDPARIISVYGTQGPQQVLGTPWWRFWTRARAAKDGAQRAMLHVPVAGDLAATSAALLFGEAPKARIMSARTQEPADPDAPPKETAEDKTEARLGEIIREGGVNARLVEAAESAAAIGGVYIYPVWDKDLRPFPLLAVAQADMAVPEFRHGILQAVTFWRDLDDQNGVVTRVLERHEVEGTGETRKAVVLTAVYKGTSTRLGSQTDLATAVDLLGYVSPRVELPFKELDVEYIPNMLPNRLWRSSSQGISDYSGSETLLDALDETYASWMRDIRLAKARILVPREYLTLDSNGTPSFDLDQEVYVGMDMEPGMSSDARAMLAHQFNIRYQEHSQTARDLVARIVSNAGYSETTMGNVGAAESSGTGLRITEHKTLLTLRRKSAWWQTAVENVLHRMLLIDAEVFGSGVKPIRPAVEISDSIIDNPLELAQTALALKTAEAASTETRVRIVHPDWSTAEVLAEVARIEDSAQDDEVGAFGDPMTDPASTHNLPTTDNGEDAPGATVPPAE